MKHNPEYLTSQLSRYNRRQRKKLHLGEFEELAAKISVTFQPALEQAMFDRFLDELIAFVESRNLEVCCFGGSAPLITTTGYLSAGDKHPQYSPTNDDVQQLLNWLKNFPQTQEVTFNGMLNLHYGNWSDE